MIFKYKKLKRVCSFRLKCASSESIHRIISSEDAQLLFIFYKHALIFLLHYMLYFPDVLESKTLLFY